MKSISIDYGIMEKTKRVSMVPAKFQWNDLGSWSALYDLMEKDKNKNALQGDVLPFDTRSSLLFSKKGLLAAVGLENMVVIQTDDAVLVSSRDRTQEVKKVVERLKNQQNPLAETHSTVLRPWGQFTVLEEGTGFKIKRVVVKPGQKLSLQRHARRAERWVVIQGTAVVTRGEEVFTLRPNESTFISVGEKHRLENPGTEPLTIIEVQTGDYLGEDDIARFDDSYGRK